MAGPETNEFDFYLRFAKPLVLNLTDADGRLISLKIHTHVLTTFCDRKGIGGGMDKKIARSWSWQ